MSIEEHIEALSVTVNNLTTALNTIITLVESAQQELPQPKPSPQPKQAQPKKAKAEPTKPTEPTYTHDDLRKLCTKTNTQDNANHLKIKALISSYHNAKKVLDLNNEEVQEVFDKLTKGDF